MMTTTFLVPCSVAKPHSYMANKEEEISNIKMYITPQSLKSLRSVLLSKSVQSLHSMQKTVIQTAITLNSNSYKLKAKPKGRKQLLCPDQHLSLTQISGSDSNKMTKATTTTRSSKSSRNR